MSRDIPFFEMFTELQLSGQLRLALAGAVINSACIDQAAMALGLHLTTQIELGEAEAAELLECFQWSGADLDPSGSKERIREELADVMMYCIYLADVEGIDIPAALHDKIRRNAEHYPVDKATGSAKKYTEL